MNARRPTCETSTLRLVAAGLCLLVPLVMGGCPEFRNETVGALSSAADGIIVGGQPSDEAMDAASRTIASAAIDLFFSQFQSDEFR